VQQPRISLCKEMSSGVGDHVPAGSLVFFFVTAPIGKLTVTSISCCNCCRHAGHAVTEAELTETGAAAAASGGGGGSPRGSNGSSGGWTEGEGGKDAKGVWKILWRGGGIQQQLSFEATQTT
jgi:hypothetical protein